MRYSFVTSLDHFVLSEPFGAGWSITDELKISNSSTIAKRLVTDVLHQEIGRLEARTILSGKPFVYVESEYPLDDTSPKAQLSLLNSHLAYIQLFLNILWIIKDNSVNFDLGFLQYPYTPAPAVRVSSNGRGVLFSNSEGELRDAKFSKSDVVTAIELFKSFYGPISSKIPRTATTMAPESQDDRLSRAFYFLQSARGAPVVAEKVASYCTCFEALVSTSTTELSHQVAERVAMLICEDSSEATEIYSNLKRAYDTRSRLVHGGRLTAGTNRYIVDSSNSDNYLRRLLLKFMVDPDLREAVDKNESEVNGYFLKRLFEGIKAPT